MGIKAKFTLPHPCQKSQWRKAFEEIEKMVDDGVIDASKSFMLYFTDGKDTRTLQQNRYYWAVVLKTFAESIGYEPEDVHELFKRQFAGYTMKKYVDGKRRKIPNTTSGMSKPEFSVYIDKCIRFCAEYGIVIPSPEALRDEELVTLVSDGVLKA